MMIWSHVRPAFSTSKSTSRRAASCTSIGRKALCRAAVDELSEAMPTTSVSYSATSSSISSSCSRDAATELSIGRPLLRSVVDSEAAAMELDRRIVERERHVRRFLDRRDQVGQKCQHLLQASRASTRVPSMFSVR